MIDGCAVPTEQIAGLIDTFVANYESTHTSRVESRNARGRFTGKRRVTAIKILHERVVLHAQDSGVTPVPEDSIRSVLARKRKLTELRTVDPLVQALGLPEAWHDGTLTVVPNPRAPAARRAACCGGTANSLNGSAGPR